MSGQDRTRPSAKEKPRAPNPPGSEGKGDIRVLVLFGAVPLYGQERGNLRVFQGLGELGVQVKFLTHAGAGHLAVEPEIERLGFSYARAPYGPLFTVRGLTFSTLGRIVKGLYGTNRALLREIRDFRPTHLHTMNPAYLAYASPAVFFSRVPLIYRIGDHPPVRSLPYRLVWNLMKRRVSTLVANSDYVEGLCKSHGFPAEKLKRIYTAPEMRSPASAQTIALSVTHFEWPQRHETVQIARDDTKLNVIFSGQLAREKGFDLVVEAAEKLIRSGAPLRVFFAGDYSYHRSEALRLKQDIEAKGLSDRIVFLGYVDNVADLFSIADVHVCPSRWNEPLSNAVLEAKRTGIPSIIFPNGGLPELVRHGVDGWVCQDQSAAGIEEALSYYIAHPAERAAQGRAAAEGASGANMFGWDRFKSEWLSVFIATKRAAAPNTP